MTEPMEQMEYKGVTISIFRDEDPVCPREWEHTGTMVCWHRHHTLGDEQPKCSPEEWRLQLALDADPKLEDVIEYWESGKGLTRVRNWIVKNQPQSTDPLERMREICRLVEERVHQAISKVLERRFVMLPLYLYDHSGLTMNTSGFSCAWDSGQAGWIYCDKAGARKQVGGGLKKIEAALRDEVQTYSYWLEGAVYGWSVGEESCWGYYGYDHEESGLLAAARGSVRELLDRRARERRRARLRHFEKLKACIRNGVALDLRPAAPRPALHPLNEPAVSL